jgi:hypothetical protein
MNSLSLRLVVCPIVLAEIDARKLVKYSMSGVVNGVPESSYHPVDTLKAVIFDIHTLQL